LCRPTIGYNGELWVFVGVINHCPITNVKLIF